MTLKEAFEIAGKEKADLNNRPSEHWKVLFDEYNANHEQKLSMKCAGCYYKVFMYVAEKFKSQS